MTSAEPAAVKSEIVRAMATRLQVVEMVESMLKNDL